VSTEGHGAGIGHGAGMRLGGASYAGRDTDAGTGARVGGVGGVVRDADTTGGAEDGSEGEGQGREALGDVIEDDGGDKTGEGSQRSVHGIVEMRQVRPSLPPSSLAPRPSTWRSIFSCSLDGVCISLRLPAYGLCGLFMLGGFPCVSQPPLTSRGACSCLHLSPLLSPPPQIVNRLVRRIHYSAFTCPSKET
jgi:hypothetical protein